MDAAIKKNDEVRIDGMGGVWIVQEIRGDEAFCVRLYTSQHDWFVLSTLKAVES
jgi:hypothetical protein